MFLIILPFVPDFHSHCCSEYDDYCPPQEAVGCGSVSPGGRGIDDLFFTECREMSPGDTRKSRKDLRPNSTNTQNKNRDKSQNDKKDKIPKAVYVVPF
jgi:hypothetical protein